MSGKRFAALIGALLLTHAAPHGVAPAGAEAAAARAQTRAAWRKLSDTADDFSLLLPVQPEIRARGGFSFGPSGEQVDEERIASAYDNGVVYVVRLYEVPDPKRLFTKYHEVFRLTDVEESKVVAGGAEGRQFFRKNEGYFHTIRVFRTKRRLYVLEAAARSADHPDVLRFFSSLTLGGGAAAAAGDPNAQTTRPAAAPAPARVAPAGTQPLTEKEVTRPAVIIHKPQPSYPARAKQMGVSGRVRLQLLLSQTGEATVVKVLQGLNGGLSESSAEVARSVKFLPAEKDGQLVPQYAEIEYSFVLR